MFAKLFLDRVVSEEEKKNQKFRANILLMQSRIHGVDGSLSTF